MMEMDPTLGLGFLQDVPNWLNVGTVSFDPNTGPALFFEAYGTYLLVASIVGVVIFGIMFWKFFHAMGDEV